MDQAFLYEALFKGWLRAGAGFFNMSEAPWILYQNEKHRRITYVCLLFSAIRNKRQFFL